MLSLLHMMSNSTLIRSKAVPGRYNLSKSTTYEMTMSVRLTPLTRDLSRYTIMQLINCWQVNQSVPLTTVIVSQHG
jgi:hypothetical protein